MDPIRKKASSLYFQNQYEARNIQDEQTCLCTDFHNCIADGNVTMVQDFFWSIENAMSQVKPFEDDAEDTQNFIMFIINSRVEYAQTLKGEHLGLEYVSSIKHILTEEEQDYCHMKHLTQF